MNVNFFFFFLMFTSTEILNIDSNSVRLRTIEKQIEELQEKSTGQQTVFQTEQTRTEQEINTTKSSITNEIKEDTKLPTLSLSGQNRNAFHSTNQEPLINDREKDWKSDDINQIATKFIGYIQSKFDALEINLIHLLYIG